MAVSVNKVILIGNLGRDPEIRYAQSGQAVANLSIATPESWTDKEGRRQDSIEWHRVVVWGRMAEACGEYLSKGRQVYVEGRLQTRQYEDRDGNSRSTTEIKATTVQFLGSRQDQAPAQHQAAAQPSSDNAPRREPRQQPLDEGTWSTERKAYPTPPEGRGGGTRHEPGADMDDIPFHHMPRCAKPLD